MGKSDRTKDRILDAARRLFNERGTARVTTHDIAASAKMSPGNLYYHYPDKDAIVRELVDAVARYDGPARSFEEFLSFVFGAAERDRYFFSEMPSLLKGDPRLAELWNSRRNKLSRALLQTANTTLQFESPEDAEDFVDGVWLLCRFSADASQARARRLLRSFLRPYRAVTGT